MTGITGAIAALSDQEAVRVLADTADYQNRLPDPAQLRALETGLRDAAASDTGLAGYAQPGASADAGDLARATLLHLAATRPELGPGHHPGHRRPRLCRPQPGLPHRRRPGRAGPANRGETHPQHPGPLDIHRAQVPGAQLHSRPGDQQAPRLPHR